MTRCGPRGKCLQPLLLLRASETFLLVLGIQEWLPSGPPAKTLRSAFTILLVESPNSSSPSRPGPLTEDLPLWLYSVIASMLLLDSLPRLSFAKTVLYLFFFPHLYFTMQLIPLFKTFGC